MAQVECIAIVGGTGALGSGLAIRSARAGYRVVVGSRSVEKAEACASEINKRIGRDGVSGASNRAAAENGDIVFITVPYQSHGSTIEDVFDAVQGKIVVDVTVPLHPPRISRVALPPGGTVAALTQKVLGDSVRVVSAFHNVAATHLQDETHQHIGDVLVFGNDKEAREEVALLARKIGFKAWHGGAIENSVVGEALTPVLIFINKFHGINGAGISVTGEAHARS